MKLIDYFNTLLTDTVNLSQTRLDQLGERVEAIYAALADDEILGAYVVDKVPQGSWAHRTIITPQRDLEFDADFLLHLSENPEWSERPGRYIGQVYSALGRTRYVDARTRKCRCVRVTYANECHVDVVPYLILPGDRQVIVNRDEDVWEDTNPSGFTDWMRGKDAVTGGNLRKVIRLLKFLRDHKGSFLGVRSVILTTLLGSMVESWKPIAQPGYYADVPTTLLHVAEDLDEWLRAHPTRPSIADPSMPSTTFDHRWHDITYLNFRDRIHSYTADIREAYDEQERGRSIELWQGIFGPGFKAPASKANSKGAFGAVPLVSGVRTGRAG